MTQSPLTQHMDETETAPDELAACPFCKERNRLFITKKYMGQHDYVECQRCEYDVPLELWRSLTRIPSPRPERQRCTGAFGRGELCSGAC